MDYRGDDTMTRFAFSILFAIAAGIGLWAGCLSVVEVQLVSVIAFGMTIDVRSEKLLSFSDARSAFPASRLQQLSHPPLDFL